MEWLFWGLSAACFLAVAIGVIAEQKAAKAREEARDILIAALFVRTNVLAEAINSHADAMQAISNSVIGGWEVTETLLKERKQRERIFSEGNQERGGENEEETQN